MTEIDYEKYRDSVPCELGVSAANAFMDDILPRLKVCFHNADNAYKELCSLLKEVEALDGIEETVKWAAEIRRRVEFAEVVVDASVEAADDLMNESCKILRNAGY